MVFRLESTQFNNMAYASQLTHSYHWAKLLDDGWSVHYSADSWKKMSALSSIDIQTYYTIVQLRRRPTSITMSYKYPYIQFASKFVFAHSKKKKKSERERITDNIGRTNNLQGTTINWQQSITQWLPTITTTNPKIFYNISHWKLCWNRETIAKWW